MVPPNARQIQVEDPIVESKTDIILDLIQMFRSVAVKYCRADNYPIRVDGETLVTTREAHMIQAIGDTPRMGVTELATLFGTSKSAASQLVSKLAEKGFLNKRPSTANNKEIRLALTDLGRAAYKAHEAQHKADKDHLVSRLETFSLSQIAVLSVMFDALDEIMDQRISRQENQK